MKLDNKIDIFSTLPPPPYPRRRGYRFCPFAVRMKPYFRNCLEYLELNLKQMVTTENYGSESVTIIDHVILLKLWPFIALI